MHPARTPFCQDSVDNRFGLRRLLGGALAGDRGVREARDRHSRPSPPLQATPPPRPAGPSAAPAAPQLYQFLSARWMHTNFEELSAHPASSREQPAPQPAPQPARSSPEPICPRACSSADCHLVCECGCADWPTCCRLRGSTYAIKIMRLENLSAKCGTIEPTLKTRW